MKTEKDETLTIPAGHHVYRVDFDADPPYCEVFSDAGFFCENDRKLLIPTSLAYYLSTHSCGSASFRKLVDDMAARSERAEIAELFERLMDKLGFKVDFEKVLELVKKTVEEE